MSSSKAPETLGVDLGSCYVKAVLVDGEGEILCSGASATGYDYGEAVRAATEGFPGEAGDTGVTGYGRHELPGSVKKTEISCLARGLRHLGISDGTLVDIGGQDCKVLHMEKGKLAGHFLNRRCAAGTGSYLEYLAFRLKLDGPAMSELAAKAGDSHTLNSFCTVFAGTEILDCIRRKVPLPELVRGMYASIVERIREMAPIHAPAYLSGGVAAHHSVILDVFSEVLARDVSAVPHPQYLAALGAALYARDGQ